MGFARRRGGVEGGRRVLERWDDGCGGLWVRSACGWNWCGEV